MVLLLAEASLRLFVAPPASHRFQQINQIVLFLGTHPSDLMLDFDSERFWKLKPSITINDVRNTFWQGTVSNSLGYRCPEFSLQKPEGTLRVVCFGDSSTFGIGATMEDTWPFQLQQILNQHMARDNALATTDSQESGRVEVINAGVPGYSSHQGLQHMRQEIDRLQPDIVMASYANNDFWHWDNQTDAEHADRLNSRSTIRSVLMNSRIAQLLDVAVASVPSTTANDADISSPNQHWAAAATWNYKEPRGEWTQRVPLDAFRKNVNSMADLCGERHLPLILVKWPDQPQAAGHWSPRIDYQTVLDEVAAERGLGIADVVSLFQANRSWSVSTYVPDDIVHVNRDGNRLAAIAAQEAIERQLNARGALTN